MLQNKIQDKCFLGFISLEERHISGANQLASVILKGLINLKLESVRHFES